MFYLSSRANALRLYTSVDYVGRSHPTFPKERKGDYTYLIVCVQPSTFLNILIIDTVKNWSEMNQRC